MKEIFIKHKIVIFRTAGSIMLFLGFVLFFWMSPKEVASENEIAAANVARMEASVSGGTSGTQKAPKPETSKFIEELKNAQEKQVRYLTILTTVFGIGFLAYSFLSKPKSDSLKEPL
ncbi:MAG: hypothetical protein QG565_1265 [Campylobacterota bacterium]|nr:hypothetical protein [Campylobacterota bacterium]MDQ1267671.1 hypothetical protein [Campylobacterota bacterium]MDQ1338109.1 hypothetical protein [Campylobacterota bacterium]